MKAFIAILILGFHCLSAQELKTDIQKARDFLQSSTEVTVDLTMNIYYSNLSEGQKFKGTIIKYEDIYFTDFNNRIMINNQKYNLIVDKNQQMAFVRKSVQTDEVYDAMVMSSLSNIDSLLESLNYTMEVKKQGMNSTLYTLRDSDGGSQIEIQIGPEFLEKVKYEMTDHQKRKIKVDMNYRARKHVNQSSLRDIAIGTYLDMKDPEQPELMPKYLNYQLVNNLMP